MEIHSVLPDDMDREMKIRSLQELQKIISEEITTLQEKDDFNV